MRLLLALLALGCSLATTAASAEATRPTDDSLVLATITPARAEANRALRASLTSLKTAPQDIDVALGVARASIEQGRLWSDPRLYGQAQAALGPWWNKADSPNDVKVLQAVIKQALHDFTGAEDDLDAVLADDPANAQALMTRAQIRLLKGNVEGADQDCRALPRMVGLLTRITCEARVAILVGHAGEAMTGLEKALRFDARSTPEARRYAMLVLADAATGLGDDTAATRWLDQAVEGDVSLPVTIAEAEHFLELSQYARVLAIPALPSENETLLLIRAIAAERLGDTRFADYRQQLADRFDTARAAGVRLHIREEARFRLEIEKDPVGALALARDNWAIQHEIADARLYMAAAIAAGDPAAAQPVLDHITRTGLADRRLSSLVAEIQKRSS